MEKALFEIEVNEGFEQYEGITLGHRWNGWECPLFNIDNVNKILNNLGSEEEAKENSFSFYQYDSTYDVIIEKVYWDGKLEAIDTSKPTIFNGEKYYAIGSHNWTWTKAQEENPLTKMNTKQLEARLSWLGAFYNIWQRSQNIDDSAINNLSEVYIEYCNEWGLPQMSCDELICEILSILNN
jgi:hypothetical protein